MSFHDGFMAPVPFEVAAEHSGVYTPAVTGTIYRDFGKKPKPPIPAAFFRKVAAYLKSKIAD